MGSIQPAYIKLLEQYQAYLSFLKHDKHKTIIDKKNEQIELYKKHIELSKEKISLLKSNTALALEQLKVNEQLYREKIISKLDIDQAKQTYNELAYSGRLIDFETAISNAQIQIAKEQEEIVQIEERFVKERNKLSNATMDAYYLLEKAMNDWEKKYLSIADISGELIYSEYLTNHHYIQNGTKIMTILPQTDQQRIGLLKVSMKGFSKIRLGQEVHVRLDNYPFQEFGILHGEVVELPTVPEEGGYIIKVGFPQDLKSTYQYDFQFNQRMEGQAAIITSRLSIWQKVWNQINSTIRNS